MNGKLNFHTEENLKEILTLIIETLENILNTYKFKKTFKNEIKVNYEEIKKQTELDNIPKVELLNLIEVSYNILKKTYRESKDDWLDDEKTSFELMSNLIE